MNWRSFVKDTPLIMRKNQIKGFHGITKDNIDKGFIQLYGDVHTVIYPPKGISCKCGMKITIERAGNKQYYYCRQCGNIGKSRFSGNRKIRLIKNTELE